MDPRNMSEYDDDDDSFHRVCDLYETLTSAKQPSNPYCSAATVNRNGSVFQRGTSSPPSAPAPPARSSSTKLSFRASRQHVHYVVTDLNRVVAQKREQGADGVVNVEAPLPPPPIVVDDDESTERVDLADFPPPPPAEILESLKQMRKRPLPPLPKIQPPVVHRSMFSKVI